MNAVVTMRPRTVDWTLQNPPPPPPPKPPPELPLPLKPEPLVEPELLEPALLEPLELRDDDVIALPAWLDITLRSLMKSEGWKLRPLAP